MNLTEFNALKPGDRIENAMSGSTGEVVEADSKGVRVAWNEAGRHGGGGKPEGALRHYSRFSTIWFHWSKVDADLDCPGLEKCEREDCRRGEQCLGGSKADYDRLAGAK